MKIANIKKITVKRLSIAEAIKLARKIRRANKRNLNLPDDFDVVKYIHENR